MDFAWIWEFLYAHLGEIVLGLELFLLNVLGKPLTEEKKQKLLEKKKRKAAKKVQRAKTLMDEADIAMADIVEKEKEV